MTDTLNGGGPGTSEGKPMSVGPPSPLAAALAQLQAKLPRIGKSETGKVEGTTKDGRQFSYEYKYADLAGISAAILPLMGELGLSFIAKPTYVDGRFVLAYSLLHESGEREVGEYPLPPTGTPQQVGSAITYGRRYCLCAVTGLAPEADDDDARTASRAAQRHEEAQTELARDVADGRDKVRSAWAVSFGTEASECAEYYARWSQGLNLWDADGKELRRYAAYLASLPPAVAGSDPATVPAGPSDPVGDREAARMVDTPRAITALQRKRIFAELNGRGIRDAAEQRTFLGELIGRTIGSRGELTFADASEVIEWFEQNPKSSAGAEPVSGQVDTGRGAGADRKEKPADAPPVHPAGPEAPADPIQTTHEGDQP